MSEREIFLEALEQTLPEARAAYLRAACGQDVLLLGRVEGLLREHFSNDSLLAGPALEGAPTLTVPVADPLAAARLGRYKLLEKIGEGGFGEVWMAEQREPVKRRVALKIIKLGMDSRQIVARFEAERQALAMMDHPNIAKIHDADMADTGRPYFVMELVRGVKITEYCDRNQLPTKERLALFIQVCQAIQHAHQKGIIHRDIKPSNILVTLHDGVPVPKVIDFGIAKATQAELTDRTVFTQFQQFIGTPAYISPEQAEMSGLDIDTRADIYSLGVLLYELLVGQTPFSAREMMEGGLDALRRIIREREPQRPSTRLHTLTGEERTTTGQRRQTDPGKLAHQLQGDLDWIVMKCLEKDRARRYETASGLAADLRRHLDHEPVVARPPSVAYRIQKAWQRNRLAYTATAAVALALVVGISVSIWQAVEAIEARKAESRQRIAAEEARATAVGRRKEAEESRAREAAQRRLAEAQSYAADMNLAQQALAADNLELATDLLDHHQPRPGQPDRRGWEWRYLSQQTRSDALYTLCRKEARITGLSVSHDGRWLAVQTVRGGVSVWNLNSRREVMRAPGNWNSVAFSPTKPRLALWQANSPGTASSLTWWDAETGTFVSDPPAPSTAESGWKVGLTFLPDGQSLIASTLDRLSVRRAADGVELATHAIQIDGQGVGFPVGMARHTNLVAVGEAGRRLRVIHLPSGDEVFRATTSGSWIESVALSGDGRVLASCSGSDETVVHLWDVVSGRELGVLEGHRGFVSALVFWPDGKTLASAGADKTIRIWDVGTRRALKVLRGQQGEIHRLALLPDHSTLISGAKDGSVMVWTDLNTPRRQATTLSWPSGPHQRVPNAQHYDWTAFWSLARGGDALLTLDQDGWLRRRHGPDLQDTETLFQVDPHPREVRFSDDQQWLATYTDAGEIRVWEVSLGKWLRDLSLTNGPVTLGNFLTGTHQLAVWNTNALTLTLHDVVTGNQTASWSYSEQGPTSVTIARDGHWCLTAGTNQTGRVRRLSDGQAVGTVPLADALSGTFSPDGKQLAICYRSGWVRRWEVPSLTEREPFRGFSSAIGGFSSANHRTMTFSPDGRRLAVGSASYAMRLWDVESGRPMLTFPGETDHSLSLGLAISSDGSTVVVLHVLGTFNLWRAPSWEEIQAGEVKEPSASGHGRQPGADTSRP